MKIAIYLGSFVKNLDGVSTSVNRLVNSLIKEKAEVFVISPVIGDSHKKRSDILTFSTSSIPIFFYPQYRIGFPSFKLLTHLNEFRPDLIQISTLDITGFWMYYYALRHQIPIVFIHHTDFHSYLKYFKLHMFQNFVKEIMIRAYKDAIKVYPPTDEYANILANQGVERIKKWTRGIDREKFHPKFRSLSLRKKWGAKNKKIIMYVGRLVWYKNLQVVVDVYNRFEKQSKKDCVFVIVGDGHIASELKSMMPNAVFTGFLSNKQLSKAYASGDIFLFPSTTETYGQVVSEAMGSGMVPIVSNIGGCKEIIHNSNGGIVVENNISSEFYQACAELIYNEEVYNNKRSSGLSYAKNKSWDENNKAIVSDYKYYSLLGKKYQQITHSKEFSNRQKVNI